MVCHNWCLSFSFNYVFPSSSILSLLTFTSYFNFTILHIIEDYGITEKFLYMLQILKAVTRVDIYTNSLLVLVHFH